MQDRMKEAEEKIRKLEGSEESTMKLQTSLEKSMKSIARSLEEGRLFQQKVELRHIASEEKERDFREEVRENFKNMEARRSENSKRIFSILRSERKLRTLCERKCDVNMTRVDRAIEDINKNEKAIEKVHIRISDGNKESLSDWKKVGIGIIVGAILLVLGYLSNGGSSGPATG